MWFFWCRMPHISSALSQFDLISKEPETLTGLRPSCAEVWLNYGEIKGAFSNLLQLSAEASELITTC